MSAAAPEPYEQRATSLLRLLSEVVAATQAASREDAVRAVVAQVCAAMDWPIGHVYLLDHASGDLVSGDTWHLPDPGRYEALRRATEGSRFERGVGLPGRVLEAGAPVWIADIREDDNFPRAALARDLGVRSALAFPVLVRDEVAAVLEFFADEPTEPDEHLLALMASIGSHLGRVFERIESADSMRESAERFRAVAENAAEAIVTIDVEDRIHYVNPATAKLFGYTVEQLESMSFSELMPERFRERHRHGIRRYARTGARNIPWDGIELPGLHRDGHEVPLEVTFGEFTLSGRQLFNGIMRDVTQRRRAEAERVALLERERTARAAAEEARGEAERRARQERALREAAAAVASAFTVEETSRRIAESALIATHSDGAFVAQVHLDTSEVEVIAVAGEAAPRIGTRAPYEGSATAQVIEREEPILVERLSDYEGPLHREFFAECGECSIAVIPLLDAAQPIGSLILIRNAEFDVFRPDELARAVTFGELASLAFRKIHLLEDSERKRAEIERVMESRARLIRGFSHDVKNPLGAADGFLQLLYEGVMGRLTDAQVEGVERARRSLQSALGLIDDLLELARAEAGQIELRIAPTDVREAAREITDEFRAQAEAAGLAVTLDLPARVPLIESDPARVRQIIGNLVSNAIKYTPAGGEVTVRVAAAEKEFDPHRTPGHWIVASVTDTGPGIEPEKQKLLFQEFARLDPDVASGAGIGLAISRRLARAMGGDITVRSSRGHGSTFALWLPMQDPGARKDDPS